MAPRSQIPGLKRRTDANGSTRWWWVASQISRLTEGFLPRTVPLWRGARPPTQNELETIKHTAEQLTLDLHEWLYSDGPKLRRGKKPARGTIYFAKVGDRVKIGFSRDVYRRMVELESASGFPLELVLLKIGSVITERAMHRRFKAERINREWFRYEGAIEAFVRREHTLAARQNQPSESPTEIVRITKGASGQ